ncbi:hypothetical protein GF327_03160 [Candidatus Woesearchaeota archaeon]|nr:hypothetical protein [Candidatus Woesearchaeota archaeon]
MIKAVDKLSNEIDFYLDEINRLRYYKKDLYDSLSNLENSYQKKKLTYKEYIKKKRKILSDKSEKEAIKYYEINIKNYLEKLDYINTRLLSVVYNDKSYRDLKINSKKTKTDIPIQKKLPGIDMINFPEPEIKVLQKTISKSKKPFKKEPDKHLPFGVPVPAQRKKTPVPQPKKLGAVKNIAYSLQSKGKPILKKFWDDDNNISWRSIFSLDLLRYLFGKKAQEKEFLSDKTKILPSILTYEDQDIGKIFEEDIKGTLDPYLLEKEIKEIKNLISSQKKKIYEPSSLGYYANVTVRKISIFFIEKFPYVFKKLYLAIRLANLKLLSNTYINIMFFLSIITFVLGFPSVTFLIFIKEAVFFPSLIKSFLLSLGASVLIFAILFYYPFMKLKSRKRSINTNLPFAIDHMSSVIASGVPPTTMFKLLSVSKEYGEISVEMEKITNYIDVFGYDVLTAVRSVLAITPSSQFKEFLSGLISTVESGGELKNYLDSKSKEALMHYRLERQKYIESISTYSDIYTGVLIAAPLFFVTALSLVSMLGGTVGGIDINIIVTFGTYLVIPLLNVIFILFLEFNQPDI